MGLMRGGGGRGCVLDTAMWKLKLGCSGDYYGEELWSKDGK